jgi:hypothetical protein
MRWTEARQGLRMMKFLSILSRYEAAEFMATASVKASVRRKRLACGGTAKAAAKGMLAGRILIEAPQHLFAATAGIFLETMAAAYAV